MTRAFRFGHALRAFAAWSALALLLAAAPAGFAKKVNEDGGADQEVEDRIEDAKNDLPKNEPALASIRGSVFYNDRRTDGLFADRRDMAGNQGVQCKLATAKPDCSSISKKLAELRTKRQGQVKLIADFKGGSIAHLEEQLVSIDADIALEQGNLAQCTACGPNWLAGKYMVVDVIDSKCGKDVLASATVGYDGSFKAGFPTSSACNAVELRARLEFCNSSYCFSINKAKGNPYTLVHPGASAAKPLPVKGGDDIQVAALLFSTAEDPGVPNNVSIAANYYASIVDAILTLHKSNPIPFYRAEFGEVEYIFPSTDSSTATARSPTEVAISTFQSQPPSLRGGFAWIDGKTPAHEYGHVMHQRAWGGSYGFDGVGNSVGDAEKDTRQIAFKEAWAEFIARVVFAPTRGCHLAGFDRNGEVTIDCAAIAKRAAELRAAHDRQLEAVAAMQGHQGAGFERAQEQLKSLEAQVAAEEKRLADCRAHPTAVDYSNTETFANDNDPEDTDQNLKGPLGEGAEWRDNIVKALCDWYDSSDDDDRNLAGRGDHFAADDIHSMWANLRNMYLSADRYGGEFKNPGLWFCDYVRYYLDVRKSAAAVGAESHANHENSVRDLIYNNNIGCSMPSPD